MFQLFDFDLQVNKSQQGLANAKWNKHEAKIERLNIGGPKLSNCETWGVKINQLKLGGTKSNK
jgi:hypothetical protein